MKNEIKLLINISLFSFFIVFLGSCLQNEGIKKEIKETTAIAQTEEISRKLSEAHSTKVRLVKLKDGNKLYVEFYPTSFLSYKKSLVAFQMCDILEALKEMNLNKKQYEIVAVGEDLVDKYGNKSEEALITAIFSQKSIDKINFKNIRRRDILDLADDVSIHFEMDE